MAFIIAAVLGVIALAWFLRRLFPALFAAVFVLFAPVWLVGGALLDLLRRPLAFLRPVGLALADGDDRGAGVHHELHRPVVDAALGDEMAAPVGRQRNAVAAAGRRAAHAGRRFAHALRDAAAIEQQHGLITAGGNHLDALVRLARRHRARRAAAHDQQRLAAEHALQGDGLG